VQFKQHEKRTLLKLDPAYAVIDGAGDQEGVKSLPDQSQPANSNDPAKGKDMEKLQDLENQERQASDRGCSSDDKEQGLRPAVFIYPLDNGNDDHSNDGSDEDCEKTQDGWNETARQGKNACHEQPQDVIQGFGIIKPFLNPAYAILATVSGGGEDGAFAADWFVALVAA
jgi:hypothetical protein